MTNLHETQSAPPSPSGGSRVRVQPAAATSFDDLDLPQKTSTLPSVFCCQACIKSAKDPAFEDFISSASNNPPFESSVKSIGSICKHVIVITTSQKKPAPNMPKQPVRYFAFIETVGGYQEIDSILHTYLLDTSSFEETTSKARFTCPTHHQTFQLIRQNQEPSYVRTPAPTKPIIEAQGKSRPVLSRKDLSYEKRMFMVKMLRYGRQDLVDEIVESVQAEGREKDKKTSWDWDWKWEEQLEEERRLEQQREEERKSEEVKIQERMNFEIKHCLGKMRMLFLMGKKYVIA